MELWDDPAELDADLPEDLDFRAVCAAIGSQDWRRLRSVLRGSGFAAEDLGDLIARYVSEQPDDAGGEPSEEDGFSAS